MSLTVSSALLGRRLSAMRAAAGLTSGDVARRMECSRTKISRQEHGTHAVSTAELSHLVVHVYGQSAGDLAELDTLRRRAKESPGWWHASSAGFPLRLQ
ncbi:MAG: helix-turn-helix domain-containing protein, partial [Pseudonocardiaceae bacterium]